MKKLIFAAFLFVSFASLTQSSKENMEKYWNLRWRLKNYFMVVGPDYGEGYPAGVRNQYGDVFCVGDAPNYLATYMGVLATEIKLMKAKGLDCTETKRELYYALYALNRWDDCETQYPWGGFDSIAFANKTFPNEKIGIYIPNPKNLNGACLRQDAPNDFVQKHAESLNKNLDKNFPKKLPGDPTFVRYMYDSGLNPQFDYNVEYGYESLENFLSDGKIKYDQAIERIRHGSLLSQDHIASLLMGLSIVVKSLEESENYKELKFQDNEASFVLEAKNISERIIKYMKSCKYNLRLPNGEQIEDRWGGNAQLLAFPFAKAANKIEGKKIVKQKKLRIPIWHLALVMSPRTKSSTAWIVLKLFAVNNQSGRLFFSKNAKKNQKLMTRLSKTKNWEAFYPLIHAYLNDVSYKAKNEAIQKDLDLMPFSGNWSNETSKTNQWATSHKYHDSQEENTKGGNANFNGVYSGLEFMLTMNLYMLQNPEYVSDYLKPRK
ncbi:MAG: hypothetical protein V4622_01365 [Bacteroidota bacterium]